MTPFRNVVSRRASVMRDVATPRAEEVIERMLLPRCMSPLME
jgi:hypothetical protein